MWENLGRDMRFAVRSLRKQPGLAIVAVVTLATGLGANAAIFTVVNAVLLRPLPYAAPDRLIAIHDLTYTGEFLELQRRARAFDTASYVSRQLTLTGDGDPVRVPAAIVSPNLQTLLGTPPLLGRTLTDGDELDRNGVVAVIAYDLWRARFAGDPAIVGRQITVDGTSRTIVGVMPPLFAFPAVETQLWLPSSINPSDRIGLWSTSRRMIGRLRPGFSVADAHLDVRTLAPSMRTLFPWSMPADYGRTAAAVPLRESLVQNVRPMLGLLLGAVAVVLLIACVNVSHLLVARTLARRRDFAIRASLGASRGRLLTHTLAEGIVLVVGGVIAAWPVGYAAIRYLSSWLSTDMPRPVTFTFDARLSLFAALAVGGAVLLVGLLPAIRASRVDVAPQLTDGQRTGASRHTRWTANVLVATQMAFAVVLVITAVLLVRSLRNLSAVSPGFRTEQVLSARISPPPHRYATVASRRELYGGVLAHAATIPGVTAAAVGNTIPFSGDVFSSVFIIDGRPNPATTGEWPLADVSATVSPRFFDVLGISLRAGRVFSDDDTGSSMRVAIISESIARRYWPGESPLGRRFTFPGDRDGMRTIVGVVADVKWQRINDEPQSSLYVPLAQGSPGPMRLVLRTANEPAATFAHVRSVVRTLDSDTPVDQMRPIEDWIAASVAQPRLAATLLSGFAAAGLLLAAIGIYGTISDHVTRRRREIGVRMALGARAPDVVRTVVAGTFVVLAAGAAAGVAVAFAVTRAFASLLYGVTATDTATFIASVGLLLLTALVAAFAPARRAVRIEPIRAFRE